MQKALKSRRHQSEGFSLMELLVVVAIILIISAMAIPNINNTLRVVQMKSTGTEIAGMFEQARMQAIRLNANNGLQVRNYVDGGGRTRFYVDFSGDRNFTAGEPTAILPRGYSVPAAPPAGINLKFPGNLNPLVLGVETEGGVVNPILGFNARGLPCSGAPCSSMIGNVVGYVTYYTDGRRTGAVAIYPTGKVKIYIYDGTKYE